MEGDCRIDGVPATGAEVVLDYAQSVGATTDRLLPTGRERDEVFVRELACTVPVSVVDVANACAFFPADVLGWRGTEGPTEVSQEHLRAADAIKREVAQLLGLRPDGLVPIPVAVAPPAEYRTLQGQWVGEGEVDLLVRLLGGRPASLHKAFAATAAAATAVASRIPGTVACEAARPRAEDQVVLGHPSGTFPVRVKVSGGPGAWRVERASYSRTARRLMEGYAFVRARVWAPARDTVNP